MVLFVLPYTGASRVALVLKNPSAKAGDMKCVFDPWEEPLKEEMANHSSTPAWEIPWTEEPGRLQSMGLQSQTELSDFYSLTRLNLCYI